MTGLLFLFLLVILSPVFIAYIVYRWLKRKGYPKTGAGILIGVLCAWGYLVYITLYPGEDFYKEEFELATKMKFPASAEIISKSAGYPDLTGDYDACVLFKPGKKEYKELLYTVKQDTCFFQLPEMQFSGNAYEYVVARQKEKAPLYVFKSDYCRSRFILFVLFYRDESVLVYWVRV